MDVKYLEPLVRRAVQEKFPDSLHTMFEILKRASLLGSATPTMNGIPGIGENINDAIRKLVFDNFYTIKGNPMDPITELDIIQRLAEPLETQKKTDYLELVFPADNPHVYELFCKLMSYSLSMKLGVCLWKCSKYLKGLDMLHPLKLKVVNVLRADFCQISHLNIDDIIILPAYSRDLAAMFINTLFAQTSLPEGVSEVGVIAAWLSKDYELLGMIKPQISNLIRWYLSLCCQGIHDKDLLWKMHLAILEGVQHRSSAVTHRGAKKHACLTGDDVKSWVKCLSGDCKPAVDMLLQLVYAFLSTNMLSITQEDMDWCMQNITETEFSRLITETKALNVT